jgi:hypothetical protein
MARPTKAQIEAEADFVRQALKEDGGRKATEFEVSTAAHIRLLQKRVAELEERPAGLAYGGVWSRSSKYLAGHCATHEGALWHCTVSNQGCPPGQSACWRLMAKSGQPKSKAKQK